MNNSSTGGNDSPPPSEPEEIVLYILSGLSVLQEELKCVGDGGGSGEVWGSLMDMIPQQPNTG